MVCSRPPGKRIHRCASCPRRRRTPLSRHEKLSGRDNRLRRCRAQKGYSFPPPVCVILCEKSAFAGVQTSSLLFAPLSQSPSGAIRIAFIMYFERHPPVGAKDRCLPFLFWLFRGFEAQRSVVWPLSFPHIDLPSGSSPLTRAHLYSAIPIVRLL